MLNQLKKDIINKKMSYFIDQHKNNNIKKKIIIKDDYYNYIKDKYKFKEIEYKDLITIPYKNEIIIIKHIEENYFVSNKDINNIIDFNIINNINLHNSYILFLKKRITLFKENSLLII